MGSGSSNGTASDNDDKSGDSDTEDNHININSSNVVHGMMEESKKSIVHMNLVTRASHRTDTIGRGRRMFNDDDDSDNDNDKNAQISTLDMLMMKQKQQKQQQ